MELGTKTKLLAVGVGAAGFLALLAWQAKRMSKATSVQSTP